MRVRNSTHETIKPLLSWPNFGGLNTFDTQNQYSNSNT